jgi:hypothetical protein
MSYKFLNWTRDFGPRTVMKIQCIAGFGSKVIEEPLLKADAEAALQI